MPLVWDIWVHFEATAGMGLKFLHFHVAAGGTGTKSRTR